MQTKTYLKLILSLDETTKSTKKNEKKHPLKLCFWSFSHFRKIFFHIREGGPPYGLLATTPMASWHLPPMGSWHPPCLNLMKFFCSEVFFHKIQFLGPKSPKNANETAQQISNPAFVSFKVVFDQGP